MATTKPGTSAKQLSAKAKAEAKALAAAQQADAEAAALAALGVIALPAGAPSRGGARGRVEFDPAAHDVAGIVIPAGLPAMKTIQAMHAILLCNPERYISRSQLAAICLQAGIPSRNGADGVRHTATCQTGNQGTQETGFVFAIGNAADGEKGYRIDKQASELACVRAIKPGGWEGQSKAVRRRGADGFPWALLTPEARAAGFRGTGS